MFGPQVLALTNNNIVIYCRTRHAYQLIYDMSGFSKALTSLWSTLICSHLKSDHILSSFHLFLRKVPYVGVRLSNSIPWTSVLENLKEDYNTKLEVDYNTKQWARSLKRRDKSSDIYSLMLTNFTVWKEFNLHNLLV